MEQAGHVCLGFVEWDRFARKSYEAIHDTKEEWTWNDISTIDYRNIPKSDCWTFGFPCQDISIGGKTQGFDGKRSSLFFAVTKLLRQTKEWSPERLPKKLFIENVKNFLSVNGGWDFLKAQIELGEIGYDCEWELLNSREFGVPQSRDRVFIIGHLRGHSRREVFPIRRTIAATPLPRTGGFKIINNTVQGYDYAGENDVINFAFPGSNTRRGRVGRGYFQTIDTQCSQAVLDKGRWRQITPREAFRIQGFPDWAFDKAREVNSDVQLFKQAGNSVTVPVIYEIAKRLV
ncbi:MULTISPECIES: DNA cytosine methyltransferase [Bacillus cereus group]|uniref:DNA cytosine methyltransferase n=1 Tax=Bacillus cereus group TaxID=86661 RepID=UPI00211D642C|nr:MULTISPECIES: DNA (cytosine-5-)-methyltransferase [Bacillus cereus group]WIG37322.1 DNA (cytosine-5-)-methyltransferase [Bacillus toyonensis]